MSILNDNLEEKLEEITPQLLRVMGFTSEYRYEWEFTYRDRHSYYNTTFLINIVFPNDNRYVSHNIGDGRHAGRMIKKPIFCIRYLKQLKTRYTSFYSFNDTSFVETRVLPSTTQLLQIIDLCKAKKFKEVRNILNGLK